MGVRGLELADPLAQYGKITAIQQAQQQNQLAQLQMQQAMREQESTNALNRAYAEAYNTQTGDIDLNKLRKSLSAGGFGSKLPGIEKTFAELAKEKLAQDKLRGEIAQQPVTLEKLRGEIAQQPVTLEKLRGEITGQGLTQEKLRGEIAGQATTQAVAQASLVDAKLKQARSFLDTVDPNDPAAPQKYIAWHEANHRDPVLGPLLESRGITADQSRAQIMQAIQQGPQAFAELLNRSKLGTEKFMELNKPQVTSQTLGGTVRALQIPGLGGAATVVPGSEAAVTMTPAQIEQDKRDRERIKQEGQRIGLEGRRVKVLEENLRRDADPAFQQRMAAAKATGEAAAKGDVAAQQALPKIITRAEEGLRLIDEMVGKQEVRDASGKVIQAATKPHPGFQNAVGATWLPGARFVPGTDAANFMARFDQIKGASFLEAFESLKGGGAITEKEGAKATDAINRMSISTDEKEFMSAARDLQEVVRKGVANAQSRASRSGGAPSTPSNIDALLQKYK
jgi:hypothetical protein